MEKRPVRAAVAVVAAIALWAIAAAADAGNPRAGLNGDYGMTFSQTCVLTPIVPPPALGFDPDTRRLLTEGEIVSAVSSGIINFDKDGSVAIEDGRLSEVFHASVEPGDLPIISGNEYACQGSYELDAGGRLSMELACEVKVPQPGVAVTLKPFKLEGFVSRGNQNVHLSAIEGNVQTLEVAVQGHVVQQRQRVCLQSVSASRLGK